MECDLVVVAHDAWQQRLLEARPYRAFELLARGPRSMSAAGCPPSATWRMASRAHASATTRGGMWAMPQPTLQHNTLRNTEDLERGRTRLGRPARLLFRRLAHTGPARRRASGPAHRRHSLRNDGDAEHARSPLLDATVGVADEVEPGAARRASVRDDECVGLAAGSPLSSSSAIGVGRTACPRHPPAQRSAPTGSDNRTTSPLERYDTTSSTTTLEGARVRLSKRSPSPSWRSPWRLVAACSARPAVSRPDAPPPRAAI